MRQSHFTQPNQQQSINLPVTTMSGHKHVRASDRLAPGTIVGERHQSRSCTFFSEQCFKDNGLLPHTLPYAPLRPPISSWNSTSHSSRRFRSPALILLALLLLPPFRTHPSQPASALIPITRSILALISGTLSFTLPLTYHVPSSVGPTYRLALVALYGGCRVLDVFYISPYLFGHTPRRVNYHHAARTETPGLDPEEGMSYFSLHFLTPKKQPVTEIATTDEGWPHDWWDRTTWAMELELSMRIAGFTWTSADVRHTRKTWMPTVGNRVHSIAVHVLPVLRLSWAIIRFVYIGYLDSSSGSIASRSGFDTLAFVLQLLLAAALGGFLMSAFSLGS